MLCHLILTAIRGMTIKHSLAVGYLDMTNQVLIGKEFWDFVGGEGTYDEVLAIYREVGEEMRPEVTQRFGL